MSVKIRLQRVGKRDQALYRIVVMEKRSKMSGKTLALLGTANLDIKPKSVKLDKKALELWISKGAELNNSVRKLLEL